MATNNVTVFMKNNPYGYKVNISHPKVRELYDRYKKWRGVGASIPLTDKERFEFESYIIKLYQKNNSEFETR